jgi:hypothetical protein
MASARLKKAILNLGNSRTEAEALVNAKYSPSYARSGQIKRTKAFKDLMEKNLPDTMLLKVHKEGLKAGRKIYKNNNETKQIEEVGIEPDHAVRHKYLDTAYKIKGKYPKENIGVAVQVNVNEDREKYA